MINREIAGETHFDFGPTSHSHLIKIDGEEVGVLSNATGVYEVLFWLHGAPFTSVSLQVVEAISVERKKLLDDLVIPPSFYLDFSDTMDPKARDIKQESKFIGSLQWHDNPRVVLYVPKGSSNIRISVDNLDQILREYDRIKQKRKTS